MTFGKLRQLKLRHALCRLHHKERKLLSQRIPVKPLTEEEYQTHLFRIPPIEPKEEQTVSWFETTFQ